MAEKRLIDAMQTVIKLSGRITPLIQMGANPTQVYYEVLQVIAEAKTVDAVEVVHGRCEVCRGESVITQDCDNGYSIEVDAEQSELAVWYGDQCLAVFSIDYCPNCGARMDGGAQK